MKEKKFIILDAITEEILGVERQRRNVFDPTQYVLGWIELDSSPYEARFVSAFEGPDLYRVTFFGANLDEATEDLITILDAFSSSGSNANREKSFIYTKDLGLNSSSVYKDTNSRV